MADDVDFPLDPLLGGKPLPSTSRRVDSGRPRTIFNKGQGRFNNSESRRRGSDTDDSNTSLSEQDDENNDENQLYSDDDDYEEDDEYVDPPLGTKRRLWRTEEGSGDKGKGRAYLPEEEEEEDDEEDGEELFEDKAGIGRLIGVIRDSHRIGAQSDTRTALAREFDRTIEEEMETLEEDTFGFGGMASSKKNKRSQRRAGGRRETEPSAEVKLLLGQAMKFYGEGDHDEAFTLFTEVVRIDPTIKQPWYVLATIEEGRGNLERAISFKIVAAHLTSAKQAAAEWALLGGQSRDIGLLQQAIYCYTQAIKGNRNDFDSMWDRAVLLKLSGNVKLASRAFSAILQIYPHDPGTLRELAPLLNDQNQYQKASKLLLEAFEYWRSETPHVTEDILNDPSTFGMNDLEMLADFLNIQSNHSTAVRIIKQGVRWLQGREKHVKWDSLDDDREFDRQRKTRPGFASISKQLESAPVYELDVRLRLRLGIARMGQGKFEEAQRQFDIVREEDVAEFPIMYDSIAKCYFEHKMFGKALEIYQIMAEDEETNNSQIWYKIGQCHQEEGDLEEAQTCFVEVVKEEPDNLEVKMQLAKVYEQMGQTSEALAVIDDITEVRRRLQGTAQEPYGVDRSGRSRKRSEIRPQMSKEDRAAWETERRASEQQRQHEFKLAYQALRDVEPAMDAGDEAARTRWLDVATLLVDSFRETRQLFPSDSRKKFKGLFTKRWTRGRVAEADLETQVEQMSERLERTLQPEELEDLEEDSFRGLTFDAWLSLIIRYSFILMRHNEPEAALETLSHVQSANVFKQNASRTMKIRLARASCAMFVNDYAEAVNHVRWVWLRYPHTTSMVQLLFGMLSGGAASIEAMNSANLQKFMIRQLKQLEATARGGKDKEAQESDDSEKDRDEERQIDQSGLNQFKPSKRSPFYLFAYGSMLMISKSYPSAIIYFLRAYALAPKQPLINLYVGIAYLHRAMSRQTDNRHHQIAQALAFLSQYARLQGSCPEVQYNLARAYHQLGLRNYAVQTYMVCLDMVAAARREQEQARMKMDNHPDGDDIDEEPDDIGRIAAYNLVQLHVFCGQSSLGREVAAKWLAV